MCLGIGNHTILNSICGFLGGIDDVAEGRDNLLQFRIGIRCILPYLISLRSQVHIIVVIIIQRPTLFVIHVTEVLFITLKENFVTSHNVGILIDTGIQSGAKADNSLYTLSWEE